ncbi:unnamed protein product [Moneuplotes crassus]|uniref:Uncharacterized protein n=1 Tax=Euplotes crassus TaxID=5936 RepID=A0AAD1XQ70_EUPCR|nr:unnamed protein product [Moneuplotes crassus]
MEANSSALSKISRTEKERNKKEYRLLSKLNYILQGEFQFGERDPNQNRSLDFARLEGFMKKASRFPVFCSFVHWDFNIFLNDGVYCKKQAIKFIQKKLLRFNSLEIANTKFPTQRSQRQFLPGKLCDLARNISFITERVYLNGLVINEKELRSLLMASCNLKEFRFEFCTILNENKRIFPKAKIKIETIFFLKSGVLNINSNNAENSKGVKMSLKNPIVCSAKSLLDNQKDLWHILNTIKSCVDVGFLKTIEFKCCSVNPLHLEQWKEAHPELSTINILSDEYQH